MTSCRNHKTASRLIKLSALAASLFLISGCMQSKPSAETTGSSTDERPPNFLILVADDLGVASMKDWGITDRMASTVNLNQLAEEGMRFDQFWSQPVCTPMRVSTLTGRFGFRHSVLSPLYGIDTLIGLPLPEEDPEITIPVLDFSPFGKPVGPGAPAAPPVGPNGPPPGPSLDEVFLPSVLKSLDKGYKTGAFGKWHMASTNNGAENHPNLAGFDHFSGPIDGVVGTFTAWLHVENGNAYNTVGYVDQRTADDTSEWIAEQEDPWMAWVSFINPHEPFHKPPVDLIQSDDLKALDPEGMTNFNTTDYYRAMLEAMDTLSGQIIANIPEDQIDNTYIIWLGDNGDEDSAYPPEDRKGRRKTSNYQGGVHVPFIIKGPNIEPGSVNENMAHVVDIFGTVIELAGGDQSTVEATIDSQPFTDQLLGKENPRVREWNFADVGLFTPSQTIRNEQFKLIRSRKGDELYDLYNDPTETSNLVDVENEYVKQVYADLSSQLEALLATKPAD